MAKGTLAGWGRQFAPATEVFPDDLEKAPLELCRGLGRSYGDAALPAPSRHHLVNTTRANRILSFDAATGILRAEAGLSYRDINALFLPRGFFMPVTPGTQFVTLGGAVSADVHGKNHHRDGCIGEHLSGMHIRVASGDIIECSPTKEPGLFYAAVSGMGLLGQILDVSVRLVRVPSPWIWQESERVANVDEYVERLKAAAADWPMTVGWIDCLTEGDALGRGILMKGRWAEPHEAPPRFPPKGIEVRVPVAAPEWVLSRPVVQAFNFGFYWKHYQHRKEGIIDPFRYFYPLDAVLDWNLAYGRRGLTQYQCVLPTSAGSGAARRFLSILTARGGASFLCVIKDCGNESKALLSFPRPGISIAVDIAVRDDTQQLVDALNECVLGMGGRIYLAKDTFTRSEHFQAMEGSRLKKFLSMRDSWDPNRQFKSLQSVRLMGDTP